MPLAALVRTLGLNQPGGTLWDMALIRRLRYLLPYRTHRNSPHNTGGYRVQILGVEVT